VTGTRALLLSEAELRALLQREEGQFVEFKSLWDQRPGVRRALDRRQARDMVAEHVAAFANADGGTLVLGAEDDGQPTGHGYPEEAVRDLLLVCERRLRPPVRCRTQRTHLDGNELLVLEVPIAPEAVMIDGNGFPYRVGDRVLREPQEVINARKEAYRRVGYERRVQPDATLADVDLALAADLFRRTVFQDRNVEEMLERYGLIVPRAGGSGVTNACLLLFGRAPLVRWHPRAGIRFFRVAGSERRHGVTRNVTQLPRLDLPLAAAIPEAHRLAREQIRRSEKLHDLFFREMPEYPEFAWQEALVNAFAHRDYVDQAREIEVWFYDDRMEVRSPGEPVPPVTLDLLRRRQPIHASRNPLIVRVLADAGIMREEGEGIPRMFEEMEEAFLHVPALAVESGEFVVALRNDPIFEGPSAEWQRIVQSLPLSVAQRRVLVAHPQVFRNEDYRKLNEVDRDQAYREIQEMVSLGVILPPASHGPAAMYRLAPSLHEARAFLSERVPRLREHLAAQPFLRNADYREMFGVTRFAAARELRRLVQDGYLRLEGERRGARYVAGPALSGTGMK
jgi:ATP-dependent DNA helicase RecG